MTFTDKGFEVSSSGALVSFLILLSLLPLIQTWDLRNSLLNDDSLITLTYSRNLGEGKGFIYNAPPAILGTTTPLWTLLCALGHFILPSVPLTRLAVLLSGFFWLSAIWMLLVFRKVFHLQPLTLFTTAALMASLNPLGSLGMEAFLFAFLILLSSGLFFSGHLFWSGFTVALLFLTRGEGILLLAIQLATLLFRQHLKKKRFDLSGMMRLLGGFFIPCFAWAAYALPTFHTILPNTLGAKIAQARSGFFQSFGQKFWSEWLPNFKPNWRLVSPWLNIWIILFFLGLIVMIRNRRPLCIVLAWLGFYFSGYSLLGVAAYSWYMFPISWISGLAVAEAIVFLSTQLRKYQPRFFKDGLASWGVILIFIATIIITVASTMKSYRPHPKCPTYIEICRWFERNTFPNQSIAYFEVGYLGFYTRNPIVDQLGLVTSGVEAEISHRDFSSIFWFHKPDYFLHLCESDFQSQIISDPRFKKNYFKVVTFPGWGKNPLIIFKHR